MVGMASYSDGGSLNSAVPKSSGFGGGVGGAGRGGFLPWLSLELSLPLGLVMVDVSPVESVPEQVNSSLIYAYAQDMYAASSRTLTTLDSRLATIIGFSGLMVRFTADLPAQTPLTNGLRIGAAVSALVATILSLTGFLSRPTGKIYLPKALLQDWYHEPEDNLRNAITRQWQASIDEFKQLAERKSRKLNASIFALALTAILFALNAIL